MRFLRHWPAALGALLPLAAVVELAGNAWTANLVPSDAAFAEARRVVERQFRDGDLVVVYPDWMGQGRTALGPWMPLRDQARADILDYPRVWQLTLDGRTAPELEGLPVEQSWSFDGLSLELLRNPAGAPALWRAYDDLASAVVVVAAPDGEKPCPWQERDQAHHCGDSFGQSWVYVGPFLVTDMQQQPHQCLWAHPTQVGPIVATWNDVPAGRTLVVHTALTYTAARDMKYPPVHLETLVDGRSLGTAEQPDGAGWRTWTYEVPAPEGATTPEVRQVQLRISTEFQGMRHFCFDAAMRGPT
ncbi:MAG: hypothetical protein HY907_09660 [Deltaproteobacteria bacterium]|nr:hypothetical protein [Deltaproteobacteria bacterium]